MDAAGHPALLLVDGVSSIAACDFRMDEWKVRFLPSETKLRSEMHVAVRWRTR